MDVSPDIWGQLALEASQVYLTDGTAARSPFAGTVKLFIFLRIFNINSMYFKVLPDVKHIVLWFAHS